MLVGTSFCDTSLSGDSMGEAVAGWENGLTVGMTGERGASRGDVLGIEFASVCDEDG